MVGLSKSTADQGGYLEIDDELGEEVQSLVGGIGGSSYSTRRGRRSLGSSGGGSLLSYCCFMLDSSRVYKWGAAFVGLILLVATYHVGREQGRYGAASVSSEHEPAIHHPYAPVSSPSVGAKADGDGPTYKPTEAKADDNGGPTYKPTPQATPPAQATPQPTFGNHSWIDPDYPNPFVAKFNTTEWIEFHKNQQKDRVAECIDIKEKYGSYCKDDDKGAMCPPLIVDDKGWNTIADVNQLSKGPTIKCIETGDKKYNCGTGKDFNKTIWPLIRGPYCANQEEERRNQHPLPKELEPYYELGYDRVDPTKSKDADPFDGGTNENNNNLLSFDPTKVKDHFLKFEAMLEHYYQGLARPNLERHIAPTPDDVLYAPMLKSYSDQIARAILRASEGPGDDSSKVLVVGVLGDSVTAGQDNCYFDAWPEVFRRQMSPLLAAMGLELEVRNAGKNGGWAMAQQLLCAHDMLGASDRPNDVGLDFLFVCAPFVKGTAVDAEHLVRRALLGNSHTVVSMSVQDGMNKDRMLERYAKLGLSVGTPQETAVPELGYPPSFKYWFSPQHEAFWGMQDDGFCHLTTRSGSSSILNRNWHWGPKVHQSYGDAYALLFSRAARQAIDDLSAGRMPPEPRKPNEIGQVMKEEDLKQKDDEPPSWRNILFSDMGSDEAVQGGIAGVRCAVGPANQAGSTLLPHWLRPAEGSPFEEKMKARNGVSFVPSDHDADDSKFYKVQSPISGPNKLVPINDWVADPKTFGAEAPRTAEQCRHVDGSTMVDMGKKPESGLSWLVWDVPKGAVSIGHALICIPRGQNKLEEGVFDEGKIRFHYAVPGGKTGEWKVIEDSHKFKSFSFVGQNCMPVIAEMNEGDLKAVRDGGMWAAVEWKDEGVFTFDYLVVM